MIKNDYPGLFIAIEGLDGSGKSTQAAAVARYLIKGGQKTFITFEPSGLIIGNLIRARLLGEWRSSPEALQLLFAADRAEHLEKEIIPRLKKGVCVITDRYAFSSFAYGAVEYDLDWLIDINSRFIAPDLVAYLDVAPDACLKRIETKRGSYELFEKVGILKKVAQNYTSVFKRKEFKKITFARVSGEIGINEATEEILPLINSLIIKKAARTAKK